MKFLAPIKILAKANYKMQSKSKLALFTSLLTPLGYTAVFISQMIIYYQINKAPFGNLSLEMFFVCLFANQIVVGLNFQFSLLLLSRNIIDSDFDIILLRPISLFYFKFFRSLTINQPIMFLLYLIGFIASIRFANLELIIILKFIIFIFITVLIINNFYAFIYGFSFFLRKFQPLRKIFDSFQETTQLRPPEIFPSSIRSIFTFLIPFIVINGFIFELVRGKDDLNFWIITISWVFIAFFLNKIIWTIGLKRYESKG